MSGHSVAIIQNTIYHFETTISLYQVLKNLGYNPYIYRCVKNHYEQVEFLKFYNVNILTKNLLDECSCAFVVSTYPNPSVDFENAIPNINNWIFDYFKDRLIHISHKFNNKSDYDFELINKNNSICLSPLSENIGLDYISLTSCVVEPKHNPINEKIKMSIQGHFQYETRDLNVLFQSASSFTNYSEKKFLLNFIGTSAGDYMSRLKYLQNIDCKKYENINELDFYYALNSNTNWIVPLISPNTYNQTYITERYSSNFNHALALEKPIVCHEIFKNIYNLPGIYFNENNQQDLFYKLANVSFNDYENLINSFAPLKEKLMKHNKEVIQEKIYFVT